jgi:hypothetical protein
MRHRKTWELFLTKMTTLSTGQVGPTAEALAMAAPDGPRGFPCVDECRCADAVHDSVVRVHQALTDQMFEPVLQLAKAEEIWRQMASALRQEKTQTIDVRTAELLAQWRIIVSHRNAQVAHARLEFPRVWEVIEHYTQRD